MVKLRKRKGGYCLRKRFLALTALDVLTLRCIKRRMAQVTLMMADLDSDDEEHEEEFDFLVGYMDRLTAIKNSFALEPNNFVLGKPVRKNIRMDQLTDSSVSQVYKLQSCQMLRRLFEVLHLPDRITLKNGSIVSGEVCFLYSLQRLQFPCKLDTHEETYGGEVTYWSRVFNYFIDHVFRFFQHNVRLSIENWAAHFSEFAAAIQSKLEQMGLVLAEGSLVKICGYLDNTQVPTDTPGSGPVVAGINAPRYDRDIDEAFYSGWKKNHGVKFQLVTFPNGIIGDMSDVVSIRHSDLYTLRESDLNNRLVFCQVQEVSQYVLYGDSAYDVLQSHIHCKYLGDNLTPEQVHINGKLNSARVSVEHCINDIKNRFAYINYKRDMKLRMQNLTKLLTVTVLLSNCYTCLQGSQISLTYLLRPPRLEDYMTYLE
jgi:hypothetical protein